MTLKVFVLEQVKECRILRARLRERVILPMLPRQSDLVIPVQRRQKSKGPQEMRNSRLLSCREIETSLIFLRENIDRFLDFARNDKWPRCNSASSRLEKDYRAIRSRAGILHRHCL